MQEKRNGSQFEDYTLASPGQGYFADWVLAKHPEIIGQRLILNDQGVVEIEKVPHSVNPMANGYGNAFIDVFYGEFERRIPNESGRGINYFFSDELNFNIEGNLWCDDFRDEFLKWKGYDITGCWKAIFEDIGPRTPKIRLDYYDVIVQLSEERYFKPIYDWHEQRGMIFGCDHGGRGRIITEFGDYFRTVKWNQGPGNDQPSLCSDLIKSKVSASIAHLYRRPRVWLEGFYGSGWDTGSAEVADATFRNFARGHILLRFPHGGRSYFVLKKADEFKQTVPLTTKWYRNPDILGFDAMPDKQKRYCWFRFATPPGTIKMKVSSSVLMKAYLDGKELQTAEPNVFLITAAVKSKQVFLCAPQLIGVYDTAMTEEPITFETETGVYDMSRQYEEQGLAFYSGGIQFKKTVTIFTRFLGQR